MEFVYVIRREDLFDLSYPQGFVARAAQSSMVESFLDRIGQEGYFIERSKAEEDSSLKQIIPYLLVHHAGKILEVQRTQKQSESRLHTKLSIGIGGHINPTDQEEEDLIQGGIGRELNEELILDTEYQTQFVGVLNDDDNPVGAVHFGVVHRIDLDAPEVEIREKEKMEGEFYSAESIVKRKKGDPELYETWSQLLIERIDTVLP